MSAIFGLRPAMVRPDSLPLKVLLVGLLVFGPLSTDLYLPSLPAITRYFGVDVSLGQLTLSVFVAGFAVCQLVYGPLSDRFGRRPVLLAGIATYLAASLFCLFAPTIEALLFGRFLQAVGACAGPVLGRAVVRDIYPREQAARMLSYLSSAMALAPAVAPILGGWLHALFGWRANFAALAVFGAVLLVAAWRMLAETNRNRDPYATRPARMLGNYAALLRDRRFIGPTLVVAFSFAGLFCFISGSSFVLIDVIGMDPRNFGFAFGSVVAGYVSGTFLAGRLTHRVGLERMIGVGVVLGLVAGAVMAGLAWAGVETILAVVAPMSLFFLSVGLTLPNGTALAIVPFPGMAGSASAMLGFIQMGAGAVSGWLVGHLHDGTTRAMPSVVLAMAVLAGVCYLALCRGRAAGE